MSDKNNKLLNLENKSSLLFALIQLYNLKVRNISEFYKDKISSDNRINSQGEMLEWFVRDLFSGGYLIKDWKEKEEIWQNSFFHLGSVNKPPDFITHDGIAVEVKKAQTASTIHFNSSYPKKHDYLDEEKNVKLDTIYAIGKLSKTNDLEMFWLVCGDCLFARNEVYFLHREEIKTHIGSAKDSDKQGKTKELGRYNKIDPLEITDLRIRSMYQVKHPEQVFDYLLENIQIDKEKIKCFSLILENNWKNFSLELKSQIKKLSSEENFFIKDVSIKNPDNPKERLSAKFIYFYY